MALCDTVRNRARGYYAHRRVLSVIGRAAVAIAANGAVNGITIMRHGAAVVCVLAGLGGEMVIAAMLVAGAWFKFLVGGHVDLLCSRGGGLVKLGSLSGASRSCIVERDDFITSDCVLPD